MGEQADGAVSIGGSKCNGGSSNHNGNEVQRQRQMRTSVVLNRGGSGAPVPLIRSLVRPSSSMGAMRAALRLIAEATRLRRASLMKSMMRSPYMSMPMISSHMTSNLSLSSLSHRRVAGGISATATNIRTTATLTNTKTATTNTKTISTNTNLTTDGALLRRFSAAHPGLPLARTIDASSRDVLEHHKPSIFDVFEKPVPPLRKSFQFRVAVTAKPKNSEHVTTKTVDSESGSSSSSSSSSKLDLASSYASVQVGEDAFFNRHDALGIADGVGAWALTEGSNAALYSLKLMHYAYAELEKYDDISNLDYTVDDYYSMSPKDILAKSYDQVNRDAEREKIIGSTTALVAVLRDDELRIANIGDCGIMVIRNGEPIFRSEEQQHSFNFPFQLGTKNRDKPDQAQNYTIKVQVGDIVIAASDGLYDNVYDEEIVEIVTQLMHATHPELTDPQVVSNALLRRAREIAEELRYTSSPFQSRAIQEGFYYQGGKTDDTTILVGVIRLSEDSPDRR